MATKYDTVIPVINVTSEMKKGLEELAKKDRRTLSDYLRFQYYKLLEKGELACKNTKKKIK